MTLEQRDSFARRAEKLFLNLGHAVGGSIRKDSFTSLYAMDEDESVIFWMDELEKLESEIKAATLTP